MSGLPEREKAILQRLKGDFPHYAKKCLKIRPKKGAVVAFELNRVQREIHDQLERQDGGDWPGSSPNPESSPARMLHLR